MTSNQNVLRWLEEMKALVKPMNVVWIDGSREQMADLKKQALATGELEELNQELLPGCTLSPHRCQRRGTGGAPHLYLLP